MAKKNKHNRPQQGPANPIQASAIDPFAEQITQALRHQNEGRIDDAEAGYRRVLELDPDHQEANHLLGLLLYKTHYYEPASEHLGKAVEINKAHMPALFYLAQCQRSLGRLNESVETMKRYIRLGQKKKVGETNRNLGAGCLHLGMVNIELRNYQDAERWLLSGLRFDPGSAEIHDVLCLLYFEQGRSEEVEKMARRAIRSNPDHAMPYRYLVAGKKFLVRDDLMHEMERLYASPELSESGRLIMAFALGKANDDLGKHDQAFDFWTEGNRIRRRISPYVIDPTIKRMQAIKKTFNAGLLRAADPVQSESVTPVFIVGMPRSGTSLVEQILASHSEVVAAGELETLGRLALKAARSFPEDMKKFDAERWRNLGDDYLESVIKIVGGSACFVDKMPRNFMFIGMIRMMLPQAKIIHCRRNRMDTCLSCYKNDLVQEGMGYTCDLTDLGTYYRHYESLMLHWQKMLPGWIHEVNYEDIVTNTEKEIRRLLDFCGLNYQEDCLSYYQTKRTVRTASALQVRQPAYKDSVGGWEHYQRQLLPLIEALDRPPERGLAALRSRLGY